STTLRTRSQSSSLTSRNGLCGRIAALLIRMSTRPNSASAFAAIASTSALLPTSAWIGTTLTPRSRTSRATELASCSFERALTTTVAPSRASCNTVARPMLRRAPVTNATMPSSLPLCPPLLRVERVDGLVNGAGWDRIQPFMENPPEMWDQLIAINLLGAIRLSRAVLPPMIAAQHGKIVNISSDAGRVGSMGETVYAAAKGGIIAFTKSLAREMARYRIHVNCVCPGPTDTPLFQGQPERMREALT